MKTPMYDKDPMVKMTISLSPESYAWLSSDRRNLEKLRAILDEKMGTDASRRKPRA